MDGILDAIFRFAWKVWWWAIGWVFILIVWAFRFGFRAIFRAFKGMPRFDLPFKTRFEHTHIVAGTGHGKTQLLQKLILEDIAALREGRGSVIVIDSQGDMIKNILNLAVMKELQDRLILIDPHDVHVPR